MYLVVYITPNHDLIYKLTKHCYVSLYDIRSSSGWLVISISRLYKGNFISLNDYSIVNSKDVNKSLLFIRLKEKFSNDIKGFNLYILPIINTLLFLIILLFFFNRK